MQAPARGARAARDRRCARAAHRSVGRRRLGGARSGRELLLERGLAHLIASDAHTASVRAVGLRGAAAAVGDEALARWLTVEVPGAIVDGGDVPRRPETVPRRRFFQPGRQAPVG